MEKITEILLNYINTEKKDYAILINGKWGSGKTYYLKNDFKKSIGEKKITYVSLNGIKTTEQISTNLLLSYYKIGNKVEMGVDLLSTLIQMGGSYFKIGFIKNMFSSVQNIIQNTTINFSNQILIFDDIERASESLRINEILGFIHSNFVEDKGFNVILVCDEEKIKDQDTYKITKEKVVRRTLEFTKDVETFFPNYVSTLIYDESYKIFLTSEKNQIIRLFKKAKIENIRTYNFIFEIFAQIHSCLFSTSYSKHLSNLLTFTICITSQYTQKNSNFPDEKQIDLYEKLIPIARNVEIRRASKDVNELNEEQKFCLDFYETYLKDTSLYWFPSKEIFKFVKSGHFNSDLFIEELELKSDSLSKEWNVELEKLVFFTNLELNELSDCLNKIIIYLNDKKYSPHQFPYILGTVKNLIEKKIVEVDINHIKQTIDAQIEELDDQVDKLNLDIPLYSPTQFNSFNDSDSSLIIEKLNLIDEKRKSKRLSKQFQLLFDYAEKNQKGEFYNQYDKLRSYRIFKSIYSLGFHEKFLNLKNSSLNLFSNILDDNFLSVSNAWEIYQDEVEPLERIYSFINKMILEGEFDKLKRFNLQLFSEKISQSSNHIKNIQKH